MRNLISKVLVLRIALPATVASMTLADAYAQNPQLQTSLPSESWLTSSDVWLVWLICPLMMLVMMFACGGMHFMRRSGTNSHHH